MQRRLKLLVAVFVAGLTVLLFTKTESMLQPGPVRKAHRDTAADCWTCHTPLLGARPSACLDCHALDAIGRTTTKGEPIARGNDAMPPFHAGLRASDCRQCHVEHRGTGIVAGRPRFSHRALKADLARQCDSCHTKPDDELHSGTMPQCTSCHRSDAWTPAHFDHARYFVLDRDHKVRCATCHQSPDWATTTCYGCHEHTPRKMLAEHREEGIRDIENCAECHRSADEHEARRSGGRREDD